MFVFSSCEEQIDWEVEQSDAKLVVEARITTELLRHQVRLTKTADYFTKDQPQGVAGATVSISDGERTITLVETEEGVYEMAEAYAGEVGKTYTLNIELIAPIGEETSYTASSKIRKVMQLEDLKVFEESIEDFGEVFTEYTLSFSGQEIENQVDYFFGEVIINNELVNEDIQDYIYFNDDLLDGTYFEEQDIWSTEEELSPEDEIFLKLYSTEKGLEAYIEALQAEVNRDDILGFSGPPANVKGNISNNAIGYFYASDVSVLKAQFVE